jgi:hypothetical protein
MKHFPIRNRKKPKTAPRLKRYRCAICRKKAEKATADPPPYYCPKHIHAIDPPDYQWDHNEE